MNRNSRYAFYGSMRKGLENYSLYQRDLVFLETVELSGFKMYSLVDYPYVIRTGNLADKIVVDLFAITDPETERIIHNMELGAGYIFSEVEIADIKFGIYLFERANTDNIEVSRGDWSVLRKLSGF
ncbi:MAG: gamma-glutamylcyclotransferase [Cyclobacteriaceae bacterium]|nr:gamma-glutamylcyclotransferase [Cyclobacteriaceae bacterium]MDH4297039.1 gamma-glutamylcyclotransferase [Cyclobacteriaceae bacterium]MDH5248681.1 gamma-glutamylcyclotransferase [Cyclobacteriaceae bacterium]